MQQDWKLVVDKFVVMLSLWGCSSTKQKNWYAFTKKEVQQFLCTFYIFWMFKYDHFVLQGFDLSMAPHICNLGEDSKAFVKKVRSKATFFLCDQERKTTNSAIACNFEGLRFTYERLTRSFSSLWVHQNVVGYTWFNRLSRWWGPTSATQSPDLPKRTNVNCWVSLSKRIQNRLASSFGSSVRVAAETVRVS